MPLKSPELTKFTTVSPVLANFDYNDIARGIGYETYYLIQSQDSGGTTYLLTPNTDYSSEMTFKQVGSGTADQDFDLSPYGIARTIDGIVTFSAGVYRADAPDTTTFTAELYKYDGSTETQLGSTVTYTPNLNTGSTKMIYFRFSITNQIMPVGMILRLRVRIVETSGNTAHLGTDPAGRSNASFVTTTSKLTVPYKLDI
tara:strand:- start:59 stop:658 length:600 start_codon:yes stop_codon:yes gene_type:complete